MSESTARLRDRGMTLKKRLYFSGRNLMFPGLDLHTRSRASLTGFWMKGARDVLDAGSGNGYFSWLAYRSGARVVALNIEPLQVAKSREFLIDYKNGDPSRLSFEHRNLYDLPRETRLFDEIICYEVLEHIKRDNDVVREFYRILRPGGILHVCCPHRLHPRHQAEILDHYETGGHVRPGYTEEDYRTLLEPVGFKIEKVVGVGTLGVYHADLVIRTIRERVGDFAALPLFPFALFLVWMARLDPPVPFSIYVKALKCQDDVTS